MAASSFTGCFPPFFLSSSFSLCTELTYAIFILINILCLLERLPIWYLCCARQADPAHMFNASSHFHFSVPVSLFLLFGGDYFWPESFNIFNSWYRSLTLIGGGTCTASARGFLWVNFTGSEEVKTSEPRWNHRHFSPIGVTKAFFLGPSPWLQRGHLQQTPCCRFTGCNHGYLWDRGEKSDYVAPE